MFMLEELPVDGRDDLAHETVELIQRIGTAPGRTIMLVEHDIDVVMAISTTITVFQTGGVLAIGTPQEIRSNEAV